MKKLSFIFSIFTICISHIYLAFAQSDKLIVKEKKNTWHFKVSKSDTIFIFNPSGNNEITTWNKNELTIEITETGKAKDQKRAQTILDNISTKEKTSKKGILFFKTSIKTPYNNNNGISAVSKTDVSNPNLQISYEADISYVIHAPEYLNLDITDGAGNVTIGDLSGNLNLQVIHGCFHIKKLTGPNKKINLDPVRGDCSITSIEEGNLLGNNLQGSMLTIDEPIDTNKVKIRGWDDHRNITVH